MKYLALFFLISGTVFSQDFLTGQAARITIGQPTFTAVNNLAPSQYQIGAVSGVAYANNSLFVVDSNHIQAYPSNNRVLFYNNLSQLMFSPTVQIPQGSRCPLCIGTPEIGGASLVLGQPDFTTTTSSYQTQNGFRTPTGIATNGQILVIADTDNNRVLIWKSIPTTNNANADIVLGQPNFTTFNPPGSVTAATLRGPEGVWIQGARLFVADTHNHRVLVWNNIPTSNNQPADYVLGQPNLTTAPAPTLSDLPPTSSNLFSPTSVTSDGQRLYVADLGHNRVLIWNSIPTQSGQAADLVIGQPDMVSEISNNVAGCAFNGLDSDNNPTYPTGCTALCPVTGTDTDNNPLYPERCNKTLDFPRYVLSDGKRLFIADGGNDRVLIYNSIPTQNTPAADIILGQPDDVTDVVADTTSTSPDSNVLSSAPTSVRTPLSLAWDGTNLYVADPYDDRVAVFTIGISNLPTNGVVNAASQTVFAINTLTVGGTITAKDTVTVTITNPDVNPNVTNSYTYTVVADDTLATITKNLMELVNGLSGDGKPDPNAIARANSSNNELIFTSKIPGPAGNDLTLTTSTSTSATEILTVAAASFSGGAHAAEVAPGTLVTLTGTNLSSTTAVGNPDSNGYYPTSLAGVEVYFDGIRAPLLYVSPTQINTQIPVEAFGSNGMSAYVRTVNADGSVTATTAIGIPIVAENPGIFAEPGQEPRVGIAYHYSSNAIGAVSVDGSIVPGDTASVSIEDRTYTYTITASDSLTSVRDGLMVLMNANPGEKVRATPSGEFTRLILTAKVAGPAGDGIPISTASTGTGIAMTALSSVTCCANIAGARVTQDNPAVPGEVIALYTTGIGVVTLGEGTNPLSQTGQIFPGPAYNIAATAVDNAQLANTTCNVLSASLKPGLLGVYEVLLQLPTGATTNPNAQLYIAQNVFVSNVVLLPVVAPGS